MINAACSVGKLGNLPFITQQNPRAIECSKYHSGKGDLQLSNAVNNKQLTARRAVKHE